MLDSICQQIWKIQQWPQEWKMLVFILIPKKGCFKEYSNFCTTALISNASKVIFKILQARFQQYMNWELPDVQTGFRNGRNTRDQMASICWIIENTREFQKKSIYFWFFDYAKALTAWITTNCGIFLKSWEYQATLPGLETWMQFKKQQLETDMKQLTGSKFGKRIWQGCLSSCSFNIYRVHHAICQAEWLTNWNQDCWEKYQQA